MEYPDRNHPARQVAAATKRRFRKRLGDLAKAMDAADMLIDSHLGKRESILRELSSKRGV